MLVSLFVDHCVGLMLCSTKNHCRQVVRSNVPNGWHPRSAIAIRKLPVDGETSIDMIPKDEPKSNVGPCRSRPVRITIVLFLGGFVENNESGGNVNLVVVG
jgi:hypothetical protein